jgi:MFS family permease
MMNVVRASWALLLGMFLLQIGNGLQGSLMGVRGAIEGFTTVELSMIASAYFVGFLGGSRIAPKFIARVGHVRVFAALGSLISAVLIAYPVLTDPYAWMVLRVIIGFSLSGVYVTAESWLNNAATNETRGQSLSAYMLVQMFGLVGAQGILSAGDPSGFLLFIIPSILVSMSFAPILLSVSPAPSFETSRPMSLAQLYKTSPFGVVGMTLMGCIFAGQFGMSAVYATEMGLSLGQLSIFVSSFFIGAIVLQYPIGWLSDRMDRRILIVGASAIGAVVCLVGIVLGPCLPGAAGGRCAVGRAGAAALCAPDRLYQRLPRLRGHGRRLRGAFVRERDRRDRRAAGDGHSDGGPDRARGLLAVHGCGSGRPHRLRALADDAAPDGVCRRG